MTNYVHMGDTIETKPNEQKQRTNQNMIWLFICVALLSPRLHRAIIIIPGTDFVRFAMPPATNGIMMLLSPAKTLDLSATNKSAEHWTRPDCSQEKTKGLAALLKKKKEGELAKLLNLSATLARTAHEVRRE